MCGEQFVHRTGYLDPRANEHDEVIAHTLEIGDEVGRQDHTEFVFDNGFHQMLEKLSTRERIEACDRFIENEQLRSLRKSKGEGSCARWPPDNLPAC